jgi:hypothetical protein
MHKALKRKEFIMKMLTKEEIVNAIKAVRGGTIARITYKTEVPIKAEFKRKGYKIIKIVETSARIGVNYGHLPSVISRNESNNGETSNKTNNYEWIIKDRVCHNTKTNKDYVALVSFNQGHHTKVKYVIDGTFVGSIDMGNEIDKVYRHIVLDSYFKKPSTPTEFRRIAFENIIKINDVGTKLYF